MISVLLLMLPILVWIVIMLLSLRELPDREPPQPTESDAYAVQAPPFTRDYTGRLWVDKRRKGFFITVRRRKVLPPGEEDQLGSG